ncbi:MAG: PCMD domain-containing protein [Crocinitomicaceae bacterium]|nr:PCMD domain-containing protein [Crocinitomicaceae bacterium]
MKKILLFALAAFSANVFSQTIPNNDFENWTVHDDPQSTGIVVDSLESGYWDSGNPMLITLPSLAAGLPKGFMYDTTFAQSGSHAVALRTGFLNGLIATGNLFNGEIDESTNGITQVLMTYNPLAPANPGRAHTETPSFFGGYYFYQPNDRYMEFNIGTQANDSLFGTIDTCMIAAIVSKWNPSLMKRDTIAYGEFKSKDSTSGFTPFLIPLNYNQAMAGDTISLLFLSSSRGTAFAGSSGSLLVLDSIYFSGDYLSIDDNMTSDLNVYTYLNNLYVKDVSSENTLIINDMLGREVYRGSLHSGDNTIDLSHLHGVHVVTIMDKEKLIKNLKVKLN